MESPEIVEISTITCPACGAQVRETMPLDACRYLYTCAACSVTLRPLPGDCCIFCSYGDTPCPPVQRDEPCRS